MVNMVARSAPPCFERRTRGFRTLGMWSVARSLNLVDLSPMRTRSEPEQARDAFLQSRQISRRHVRRIDAPVFVVVQHTIAIAGDMSRSVGCALSAYENASAGVSMSRTTLPTSQQRLTHN
jgi:hypothetical protein